MREVASKTSDVVGDGTTTATVLAQAIYAEGSKNVTAGASTDRRAWRAKINPAPTMDRDGMPPDRFTTEMM